MTRLAGILLAALGAIHIVLTTALNLDSWARWTGAGLWASVAPPGGAPSGDQYVLWLTLGSFGVPLLVLGLVVAGTARRGGVVPAYVGWVVGAWALLLSIVLVAVPGWLALVPAALIVRGARHRGSVSRVGTPSRSTLDGRRGT
ncbi:DUF6463 family protein [Saccharothrix variisporea]|uniref:Uncharacterized protein n=1 Tax=Saccharothrix variisporea TaxID=543527 RepID=A0A495XIL7_9PSEU|nr:DUF6463 family protein [Saccharothrix variisporea]RKT72965.1 hypothetical protein DFJ66_6291 [Saccharothrix variisporea]